MHVLVILNRAGQRRKEILLTADRVAVGSDPGNSILLRRDGVDPKHCVLERIPDGYQLVDLDTRHGTLVNGSYVARKRLESGDRIEFGGVTLLFERKSLRTAPAARPDDPSPDAAVASPPPTSAARPAPPRRQRRNGGVASFAGALVTVAALAGGAVAIAKLLPAPPDGTAGLVQIDRANVLIDAGLYADARDLLGGLRGSNAIVEADRAKLSGALARLEREEARSRHAKDAVRDWRAGDGLSPAQRLENARGLAANYGDLPGVGLDVVRLALEAEHAAQLVGSPGPPDIASTASVAGAFVRSGNFAGAANVWQSFSQSDLETDDVAAAAAAAAIDAEARLAADRLLQRVDALVAADDLLEALVVLGDDEVAAFRGTAAFERVDGRLETILAQVSPHPDSQGRRRAEVFGTDAAEGEPAPPARWEKPAMPRADGAGNAGTVEEALARGDELFRAGRITESIDALQGAASPGLALGLQDRVNRYVERSNRARWFLDALRSRIDAAPDAITGQRVKTRAGASGIVRAQQAGGALVVEADGGSRTVQLEELDGTSALALARRYPLSSQDELNLAYYLLIDGGAERIDAALLKALEDPAHKNAVDSAVAFLRGMPDVPEWGFFREGDRWVTFREREQARNLAAIATAAKLLDDDDPAERARGLEQMRAALPVARDEVLRVLQERRHAHLDALTDLPELGQLEKVFAQRKELEARREAALALIFDQEKYFYPYDGAEVPPDRAATYPKVQQEVDALVARVREIWGDEHGPGPTAGVTLSAKFRARQDAFKAEEALLRAALGEAFQADPRAAVLELLPLGAPKVTIRNVALDAAERQRLDRDDEILAYDAAAKTQATPAELEQVLITNRYRQMFGRRVLRVHDLLMQAARGHSDWMSRTGKFGHFEDDPERRGPGERVKLTGYQASGVGENVALVSGARNAHDAWCRSSGHHRNLLEPGHEEIGVGNVGRYWTQNFAGTTDVTGNLVDR